MMHFIKIMHFLSDLNQQYIILLCKVNKKQTRNSSDVKKNICILTTSKNLLSND